MTAQATTRALGNRLPSPGERTAANQLRKILASQTGDHDRSIRVLEPGTDKPAEITLTPYLSTLLMEVLRPIGAGDAVTLVPVSQMLTTQQAADILNVSRPFLIGLLERKEIEHQKVGRHRRIRAEDLFSYRDRRDENRKLALADLAKIDSDLL